MTTASVLTQMIFLFLLMIKILVFKSLLRNYFVINQLEALHWNGYDILNQLMVLIHLKSLLEMVT